jgi:hypothetical protein
MGMFDDLRCRYPLPVPGANDLDYQTKDLECVMDKYEIREDGGLWHEAYEASVEVTDVAPLGFYVHRNNRRWEPEMLTGEVCFYASLEPRGGMPECGWIEWSAYFKDGRIQQLNLLRHELPQSADAVDPSATDTGKPTTRD